jgi:hypothetical protein
VQAAEPNIYFLRTFGIMINKRKLLSSIKELPDSIDLTELLDRIILLDKVEVGLSQGKNGLTLSNEQAKAKLKKWLK